MRLKANWEKDLYLDFTFRNEGVFKRLSPNSVSKHMSTKIDATSPGRTTRSFQVAIRSRPCHDKKIRTVTIPCSAEIIMNWVI